MASWSRRQVLGALGAGALAPLVTPLVSACRPRGSSPGPVSARARAEDVRQRVRDAVLELSRDYVDVSALARLGQRGVAGVDGTEHRVDRWREEQLVLVVHSGGAAHEQVTGDLSADGVARAIGWLRTRVARDPAARAIEPAAPAALVTTMAGDGARDPAAASPSDWLRELEALYQRGLRAGGSRIVYRGAFLQVDDSTSFHVGGGRDLAQRIVRTRAGLTLVAWTGSAPAVDEAARSGTIGLEALAIEPDELEAAAARALAQLTARAAPTGPLDVVLDPSVTARLALDVLAPLLSARAWLTERTHLAGATLGSGAATPIAVVDDPTLAGGFGSYAFDDEGREAAATVLVDGGGAVAPLTDGASAAALGKPASGNGRRGADAALAPMPSNLAIRAGSSGAGDLVGTIDRGLVIEGGLSAAVDPQSLRVILRAARARGVRGGRFTGARYGAVELHGRLPELFGAVHGIGDRVVYHPRVAGGVAQAGGGPALATRAEVARG